MKIYKAMKKLATILLIIIGLTSCTEKPEKVAESNVGAKVVGLILNGEYIFYSHGGGLGIMYPINNHVYATLDTNTNKIQIQSHLDHNIWKHIILNFSLDDIVIGESIENNEFVLEYIYSGSYKDNNLESEFIKDVSGELLIRHWDKGHKILSGNFSFTGNALQNNGKTLKVALTDGIFDVEYLEK